MELREPAKVPGSKEERPSSSCREAEHTRKVRVGLREPPDATLPASAIDEGVCAVLSSAASSAPRQDTNQQTTSQTASPLAGTSALAIEELAQLLHLPLSGGLSLDFLADRVREEVSRGQTAWQDALFRVVRLSAEDAKHANAVNRQGSGVFVLISFFFFFF